MKKLLLVGMGPGIGMALAKQFGLEGFEVLMVARNADKLPGYTAELADMGIRSTGYAVDISDLPAFQRLMTELADEHPDLEILHYNASAFNPAAPSEIQLPVFMSDLNINITGALLAYQAFFPVFKTRGHGVIFLTGGGSAFKAPAALASLGIGKAGMRNLVFSMAEECRPFGIQVSTVTINGMVQPGTRFDPVRIAGTFKDLYGLPKGEWPEEIVLD